MYDTPACIYTEICLGTTDGGEETYQDGEGCPAKS